MAQRAPDFLPGIYTFRVFDKGEAEAVFKTLIRCRRSAEEQRYIWATLRLWRRLPRERREKIMALIGRVARTQEEGRALYDLTVRDRTPAAVSERTGLTIKRLAELRREFYERFEI